MNPHAVVQRMRAALVKRQLLRLTALCGHDIYVEIAIVLAGERNPFAVWRELGEEFAPRIGRDAPRRAA